MQVHVVQSEIFELSVDALVVPSNSTGLMTEGLPLALKERIGAEVEGELVQCAPIAIGAAVVTEGGSLHARHLIHVPTAEEPGLKVTIESVRRATRAALLAAAAHSLSVLAVPFMARRQSELTTEETARGMVDEFKAHRQDFPETVYFVDLDPAITSAFEEALRAVT